MHKRKIFLLFFPVLLSIQANTQTLTHTIDSLMRSYFTDTSYGASVLVAKGDDIIYQKAFGKANIELNIPMDTSMVFQIGSVTKQFTAVCILKLFAEGKLSLNDSIKKYIPDYPEPGAFITIHHLLNQTSGIIEYLQIKSAANDPGKYYATCLDLVNIFKNEPLKFAPGERWEYSNSNYAVLGHIIEKISGEKYTEYLEENIFRPLNMHNSYNGTVKQIIKGRVPGYSSNAKGEITNAGYLDLSYANAGGSILSTTSDMLKWSRSLVGHKILNWETLVKAITNYSTIKGIKTHYGYGWFLNEINGSNTIEHSGGTRGFASHAVYLPREDVYVVLLTNYVGCASDKIGNLVAAIAIGKPFVQPAAIALTGDELKKFAGRYILEDGFSIPVVAEGNRLFISLFGVKQEVVAVAKNKFLVRGGYAVFEFMDEDEKGFKKLMYVDRAVGSEAVRKYKN